MSSRVSQLTKILSKDFGELFDEKTKALIIPKSIGSPSGEKNIYLPQSDIKGKNSLPLVDGVGSITIEETVDKDSIVTGYTYRFFSKEYIYSTYRLSNTNSLVLEKKEEEYFSFHYDRFVDDTPHSPHVTVGYPTIRYISKEIKIDDFLAFIKETFFTYEGVKLKAKKYPIWVNRA